MNETLYFKVLLAGVNLVARKWFQNTVRIGHFRDPNLKILEGTIK